MAHLPTRGGDPSLVVFKPVPSARVRLVCLPYAGGGAQVYRTWPAELPADVELLAFEPPGRGRRFGESPLTSVDALADACAASLARVATPFVLFGHSLGAVVAYVTVHRLIATGRPLPARLLVSGTGAPSSPPRSEPLHDLPHDRFLQRLRDLNGTPAEVLDNAELMELMIPVLRADFTASETWRHAPATGKLPVPIAAFGGTDDTEVPRADVEAWGAYTTRGFTATELPGDHFFLNGAAGPALRALISRELEAVGR